VGNHSRTVAYSGQPEYMTDPIMKGFMQRAHDTAGPADNWAAPAGIKTEPAYVNRSRTASGQTVPSSATDLFPSWYSGKKAATTSQTLDKVSNKVATACTPSLAKQNSANSNSSSWNVDLFAGGSTGGNAPTNEKDDIHKCSDIKPSVTITAVNGAARSNGATLNCPLAGCTVMVHVEQGTHGLSDGTRPFPGTLNLSVNGQQTTSQPVSSSGDYSLQFTVPAGQSSATISVQVIDSVLYDGSDSAVVSVAEAPAPATPTSPTPSPPPSGMVTPLHSGGRPVFSRPNVGA